MDQALSSGSNALLLVALARASSVDVFGQLALAMIAVTALLGVSRGIVGVHLTILGGRPDELAQEAKSAAPLVLMLGATASAIGMLTSGFLHLPIAVTILAASPLVIGAQDFLRYVAITSGHAGTALMSDGLWFLGSVVAVILGVLRPATTPETLASIWVASACLALLVLASRVRVRPRFPGLGVWLRRDFRNRLSFGIEGAVSSFSTLATTAIVTAWIGLAGTSALRGSGTLIGPLSLLMSALPLVLVPELARARINRSGRQLWSKLKWVGLVLCALALAVGSLGLWLPHSIGEAILGSTWLPASRVLPVMGLEYSALAWLMAAEAGIRSLGAGRRLLSLKSAFAATSVFAVLALSRFDNVILVATGLAATAGVFAVVYVRVLIRTPGEIGTRHS